jgi:hypothetical protein
MQQLVQCGGQAHRTTLPLGLALAMHRVESIPLVDIQVSFIHLAHRRQTGSPVGC